MILGPPAAVHDRVERPCRATMVPPRAPRERSQAMKIETAEEGADVVRITLTARELHLLKFALARACYIDTPPED